MAGLLQRQRLIEHDPARAREAAHLALLRAVRTKLELERLESLHDWFNVQLMRRHFKPNKDACGIRALLPRPERPGLSRIGSSPGQGHALLALVFASAVFVARFADLVALEEQHLRASLTGIDLRR